MTLEQVLMKHAMRDDTGRDVTWQSAINAMKELQPLNDIMAKKLAQFYLLEEKLIDRMQELEVSIYNRTLPNEERVESWNEVDEEVIIRLTDVNQDCEEIAMMDPFLDVPGHNWDVGEWYAIKDILEKISSILKINS